MLTRLEVKGFKNLLDVVADFGPFTCIAGANGVGKSNLFDAIEFLSYLAAESMLEAAQRVRGTSGQRVGDPRDLFWDGYRDHERRISFAVEMIVPRAIEDDLGTPAKATSTFLRYALELGYRPPEGAAGVGRLELLKEELRHINKTDAHSHLAFQYDARRFRDVVVVNDRSSNRGFISTEVRDGSVVVNMHGDGGNRGRPQPYSAARTSRTLLSTVTTSEHPTVLAARQEMLSWRRLALEPSALRSPDSFLDPRVLGVDGRHLAGCLYRIASAAPDGPDRVYARIAGRLADLGLRVDEIDVELDPLREVLTVFLRERGGMRLPARALSEGTLRFLALCVLLEDSTVTGLICMEEPENGIHPANLKAMVDLVTDLAVDPGLPPGDDNPFRQVIVNTHSPGVVELCRPADVMLAKSVSQRAPDGLRRSGMVVAPMEGTRRAQNAGTTATSADLVAYLTSQPYAQLKLPFGRVG